MGRLQGKQLNPTCAWAKTPQILLASTVCLFLTNCASSDKFARQVDPQYGVASSPRVVEEGRPIPKGGGTYRVGKPYQLAGRTFIPEHDPNYTEEGMASWYGSDFHGRLTANGEVYDKDAITGAHKTMPLPSYARVTNLSTGRSIIVRVNDRGPYAKDRVIDLSSRAAELLRYKGNGVARVRVEYVGPAPLEGSDDRKLLATLREGQPAPAPSSVLLASTNSYVPQNSRYSVRRDSNAPIPSERPFELGRYSLAQGEERDLEAPSLIRSSRVSPPTTSAGFATTPYAPPSQANVSSFVSGRGLY